MRGLFLLLEKSRKASYYKETINGGRKHDAEWWGELDDDGKLRKCWRVSWNIRL
jgi:hypothetical protein